jgi:hypothetical protein
MNGMPDERVWELKLQNVSDQLGNLSKKLDEKIDGLVETVKLGNLSFVKILDDHESRLRKQADVDSNQAQELSALREKIAWFGGELAAVRLLVEGISKKQEERISSENAELKKLAWELLKMLMAAGTGGGAVYVAKMMRLF